MPKQKTDDLIDLISSLTRAEKRHFRLFVKRNQASEEILFLQLFDLLDKHKSYDEQMILKKITCYQEAAIVQPKSSFVQTIIDQS